LSWFRRGAQKSRADHQIAFDGFVESLRTAARAIVEQANVAATVTVIPEDDGKGPFIEVTPADSVDPAFSVFVFDVNNAAVTIGGSTVDWASDDMLDELKSLLDDRIRGRLSENVVLNSRGEPQITKLLRDNDTGVGTVWTHYSKPSALFRALSRRRKVHALPPFPPQAATPPSSTSSDGT